MALARGLSTALACLWLSSSATDHPATRAERGQRDVGIVVHHLDQGVAQVLDLGLRHIRYTLYRSLWETPLSGGSGRKASERALQAGLDPLVVVHQPPFGDFHSREMVYRAFARFMEARVAGFSRRASVATLQKRDGCCVYDVFGVGHPEISMRQRGHLYAKCCKARISAIKRSNPQALVVTGGLASAIHGGFLVGMYERQAPYDVLAIHTYGYPLALAFDSRGSTAWRTMRDHGDPRLLGILNSAWGAP